ncbi:MAG: hypothetical protein QM778_30895 [Myxococcales bacterium]
MTRPSKLVPVAGALIFTLFSGCGAPQQAQAEPAKSGPAALDPTITDSDKYSVIFENERVRVLRYHDEPGAETHRHHHPDMLMIPESEFRRRISLADGRAREIAGAPGGVMWVPAQEHVGANIGTTETDVILVELKR